MRLPKAVVRRLLAGREGAPAKAPSKAALTRRANLAREALATPPLLVEPAPGGVRIVLNGLRTRNELNRHEGGWRASAALRKAQRLRVDQALLAARPHLRDCPPARATFVRLAPGTLDPLINLPSSLKRVEDSVCEFFGVDDGVGCPIERKCDQRKRRVPGVEIVLEWANAPEKAGSE